MKAAKLKNENQKLLHLCFVLLTESQSGSAVAAELSIFGIFSQFFGSVRVLNFCFGCEKHVPVSTLFEFEMENHKSIRLVIPGDSINELNEVTDDIKVILGPGLTREGSQVYANRCGILRQKINPKLAMFWIDCHSKRYVANRNENVIGVVVGKAGDSFRVDIGTSEPATLSYLAFEGATKKNKPNISNGDVVYAKIVTASKDMEPELVCVDAYGKKSGLGQLTGDDGHGFLFSVPLHLVRKLLSHDSVLLQKLGETLKFEIAIGMNGRIWVRANECKETICIANAIWAAEHMTNNEIISMVGKLSDALAGF